MHSVEVGTISKSKKVAIVGASVLFVVLSAWQVQARREDWPLSKYDMYSVKHGAFAQRKMLYGISPKGEFPLVEAGYRVSSKFWFQFSSIEKQKHKVRELLAKVAEDYAALRATKPDAPPLMGVKVYSERWKIAPRMQGLDKLERKLLFTWSRPDAGNKAAGNEAATREAPDEPVREPESVIGVASESSNPEEAPQ
jgi:hypothetical protein